MVNTSSRWRTLFILVTILLCVSITVSVIGYTGLQADLAEARAETALAQAQKAEIQRELQRTLSDLESAQSDLEDTRLDLAIKTDEFVVLTNKFHLLSDELKKTSETVISVRSELNQATSQLFSANTKIAQVQKENSDMLKQYTSLRSKILARAGLNQPDRQTYITSDDPVVAARVQNVTGGFNNDNNKIWSDYNKMYHYVVNNISYSFDTYIPVLSVSMSDSFTWWQEYWRTPAETLQDQTGDCEDMALLLLSMMRNYNKKTYSIWAITITSKSPELLGHMAVAFPVQGGKLTILDPSGNYYTGMEYGYLNSAPISTAIYNWLAHWSREMPNAFVDGVFSETVDQEFTSTQDFINWASAR
ncbi:MAG TPA: transglutaminase-like domain-containing protein [Dehalococcoidales bacterium]|nr:transglutaminase-like domain-containing protein [Dehalococcoidales bacterium]